MFSIRLIPYSLWFFPSLFLCVSLGFAIDFLFACLSLRLNIITWLIHRIRAGIMALFSGSFIPIALLPFGLDKIFIYQPFSSLAGAPLSILVGAGNIKETLLLQVFWNMILWPLALYVFRLSQERMVSYGG